MPSTKLPLRSLDLFSGSGGITRALEGICTPVAYCDNADQSVEVLTDLMKQGKLPTAPIHRDVSKLSASWLNGGKKAGGGGVQAILGGFPCVGFSLLGKKEGFDDVQSSLFREVVRLTDELQPQILFLENVAAILQQGMKQVCEELCRKRGYELRWCIVTAANVGAPQNRARWYGLAVRPGFDISSATIGARYKPFASWSKKEPPERMKCFDKPQEAAAARLRVGLMGNAVVPDAARAAFLYLCGPMDGAVDPKPGRMLDPGRLTLLPAGSHQAKAAKRPASAGAANARWPLCGVCAPGTAQPIAMKRPVFPQALQLDLVLDPKAYKTTAAPQNRLPDLEGPVKRTRWPTPRHAGGIGPSNHLTRRTSTDLTTFTRFERSTPDGVRACRLSPLLPEWLMGYPQGWTRAAQSGFIRKKPSRPASAAG